MNKLLLAAACVLLVGSASAGAVNGQAAPRAIPYFPSVTYQGVQTPARSFDLVQLVVDYEPGAFSARESVDYVRFITVMQGTLTATIGEKTDPYTVGKNFTVPAGILAKLSNQGSDKARIYISGLKPAWADGTQVLAGAGPSSPAPRVVFSTRQAMENIPQVVNVVQAGSRYEPGLATPTHVMNHPHAMLHTEGTTGYDYFDGGKETYTAGQGGVMYEGRPGLMRNRGTDMSGFLVTWLQTPGTPLTTPMSPPPGFGSGSAASTPITPPRTGDAGLIDAGDQKKALSFGVFLVALAITGTASSLLVSNSRHR